jgi:hypothetical protein
MWIKATDAGPPAAGGRVNLDLALALLISGSGSVWVVNARLADGTSAKVSDDFATKAEAQAEADRLILNGS